MCSDTCSACIGSSTIALTGFTISCFNKRRFLFTIYCERLRSSLLFSSIKGS